MATKSTPAPKTFPSTPAGREQAYQQAKRQGEKSITFKLPAAPAPAKKRP